MRTRPMAAALVLLVLALPAAAQQRYASPTWGIDVSDFGYSDFLVYTAGPFPLDWTHEMISGEWGAAIGYDGLPLPLPTRSMWLEPAWTYPTWTTNSDFAVVQPLDAPADLDADGLPEGTAVIANADVEITIRLDFQDTGTGTPMGEGASAVLSDRYVLLVTYTVKNLRATALTGVRFYPFLHGHPANDERAEARAAYDATSRAGALQEFRYDVTQRSTNSGAIDGTPTGCQFQDRIGFSTEVAPADFGLGHFRGHDTRPATGLHVDVEQDVLGNQTSFGPDEVAGATRVDLGSIAAGASASVRVLLAVRSDDLSAGAVAPQACVKVSGPAEAPHLEVDRGACGPASPSATPWDVIVGDLAALNEDFGLVTLGTVECVANHQSLDRFTDDAGLSACRRAVYFLARESGSFNLNYGASSAGSPRWTGDGDCPP